MRVPTFRSKKAVVTIAASSALLCGAISAGQDVRPTPGPGTGVVTVTGTVDVGNPVRATQDGEWHVAVVKTADVRVTNTPTVTIAPLDFLKPGARYSVIWPAGRTETITVVQGGIGGWAQVEFNAPGGRRRWVNLAGAEAIEELGR